jgi:hypothetical protein
MNILSTALFKKCAAFLFTLLGYLQFSFLTFAQTSSEMTDYSELDEVISSLSLQIVGWSALILLVAALISLSIKKPGQGMKRLLFGLLMLATVLPTVFLAGSTVYLNVNSSSGGPVHWHADFEFWNCGQEVFLKKPVGFSNKIGTATLHEHDDKRIHLEGVVVHENNSSLGNFIRVIDGKISPTSLTIPTTSGMKTYESGDTCNGQMGAMQVFVYRVNPDNTYSQRKLEDPASYVMAPHSQVPPGDCIIFEFDTPKQRTDKLCRSFKVAREIHKLGEEVSPQ